MVFKFPLGRGPCCDHLLCGSSFLVSFRSEARTPVLIAALCTIAKGQKQPTCLPTGEWTDKMWYIPAMEYSSALKGKESPTDAMTWMALEGVTLSAINPSQKGKHYLLPHIRGPQGSHAHRSRVWRGGETGQRELLFPGCRLAVLQGEESSVGGRTVGMVT